MPGLSEFVSFIIEKSGIKDVSLIESDIILHRVLKDFCSSPLFNKYLFKGGSCLTKCYFGYYRFSVDLDFTWREQEMWAGLGEKKLRRKLLAEIKDFASFLKTVSEKLGLRFEAELKNRNFIEFGGGGRMVTFKLWKNSELIKIQVNFIEKLLFPIKKITVKTLLDGAKLSTDEKAYFEEFLDFYKPLQIMAYDEREILCEKVRAILTRRAQKLRDFYDLFMLSKHGYKIEDLAKEILEKVRASLYYRKYRSNLERNRKGLEIVEGFLEDPFERRLLIELPQRDFEDFLKVVGEKLREIANNV
jgi:predicted nucleotidyltransferase component of viral defense system